MTEPFGYIIKPFQDRELRTVIEMALYKHQAETRLRNSQEEMTTILRTAMDGFWLADAEGRFLEVNDAYCQLTGYSREELLRMAIRDVEADETPAEIAANIERIQEAWLRSVRAAAAVQGRTAGPRGGERKLSAQGLAGGWSVSSATSPTQGP